ncbi:hypothetical protein [Methanolacinia paynteri]|uniref:hypothetical protein n=1 Tax=Methanolacinia paynteri TaxID=230356 RepID=UPI0012F6913D|nr:hypothetical protein [Methanolacinia paynteri]
MEKERKPKTIVMHRIRKPLEISIDLENYEDLKENSLNTSKLVDMLIIWFRELTPHNSVLILQKTKNGLGGI